MYQLDIFDILDSEKQANNNEETVRRQLEEMPKDDSPEENVSPSVSRGQMCMFVNLRHRKAAKKGGRA